MAKQWTELERMTVPAGKRESNAISLHPRTGTVATITVYAPSGPDAMMRVSTDGERFVAFYYRGQAVKVHSASASDIPLPACKAMRIETLGEADEDRTFQVLALLEVD